MNLKILEDNSIIEIARAAEQFSNDPHSIFHHCYETFSLLAVDSDNAEYNVFIVTNKDDNEEWIAVKK